MTLDGEQLVQRSWPLVCGHGAVLAERFYLRLFEIAPEQRRLFAATDMASQERKFIAMLEEIVRQIGTPDLLVPEVTALGASHTGYGVTTNGYTVVGEALVWALEQELGPAMTPELRQAWKDAYLLVARLMLRGAEVTPR